MLMQTTIVDIHELSNSDAQFVLRIVELLKTKNTIAESEKDFLLFSSRTLEKEWENPKDSTYDNWKEFYNVQ